MAQSGKINPAKNNLHIVEDNTSHIMNTLMGLSHVQVLIGVADDASQEEKHYAGGKQGTDKRDDVGGVPSEIDNSTLAYIHENGSPINNIPPRPFLKPGIQGSKERWINHMAAAGKAAMEGNKHEMDLSLNRAGMIALLAVKNTITAGIPPPLAPRTVAARKAKHPTRKAQSAKDMTPLVDTGQMLNSLTYVIRRGRR
jgi:hypothetical protein